MRVISGIFKGVKLSKLNRFKTRPISDSDKEKLFGHISSLKDTTVLDLFAGTGSVGIEAISRGGKEIHFVEHSYKICQLIESNVKKCEGNYKFKIFHNDVFSFIKRQKSIYDIIFCCPPYDKHYSEKLLTYFNNYDSILCNGGLLIIQESVNNKFPLDGNEYFSIEKIIKSGDTMFYILKKNNS